VGKGDNLYGRLIRITAVACQGAGRSMRRAVILFTMFQACLVNARDSENLALGRKYTLSPRPNYRLCTEQGDTAQLTDGEAHGSHWARKSTVGWHWPGDIPQVTIDLGRVCFVERVEIHTAAGTRGGVKLWRYVVVLLSRDGVDYGLAGFGRVPEALMQAALREKMVQPVVGVEGINAEGRFVKILVQQETTSFFSDEIKVIGSNRQQGPPLALPVHIYSDFARRSIQAVEERLELIRGIAMTQQALTAQGQRLSLGRSDEVVGRLRAMREAHRQDRLARISEEELKRGQGELDRIRAIVYREFYSTPLVVLPADPMKQLPQAEMVFESKEIEVSASLWQREIGSLAFNIINCTQVPMTVTVSASPLTAEGRHVSPDAVFTLRRAACVYAVGVGQMADALVLQGKRPFTAEPGRVYQIWMTIDTARLPAGDYAASLAVSGLQGGQAAAAQPTAVRLTVHPIRMPEQKALNAFNWSYPNASDVTRHNLQETSRDLRSHGIAVFTVLNRNLPFPRGPADAAKPVPEQRYAAMDRLLDEFSYARTYLFLLGFTAKRRDNGAFGEWMTEPWKRNFKGWLAQLVAHLRRQGLGYDRFALYPYDEYIGDDFFQVAQVVREADPRIRIFANSYGRGPAEFARLKDLVDIWCVHQRVSQDRPDWLIAIKSFAKENWCYRALNRTAKPLDNYRMMSWWAFRHGLTGAGFWVYADTGRPFWDDYGKAMGNYGVVYGAYGSTVDTQAEVIIPSRRWEMWREGVQDYQYLVELQQRIDRVRAVDSAKAEQVQRQLNGWVSEVLLGNSARVMVVRQEITRAILHLDGIMN